MCTATLISKELVGKEVLLHVGRNGGRAPTKVEPARVVAAADAGRAVTLKLPALPQFQLPLRVAAYLFKKGAPPDEVPAATEGVIASLARKYHQAMSRMSRRYGWCPVCLEDLMGLEDMLFRRETVVLIPCSHLVHEDCLEKDSCTRSHRACPECSRPVQATVSV